MNGNKLLFAAIFCKSVEAISFKLIIPKEDEQTKAYAIQKIKEKLQIYYLSR